MSGEGIREVYVSNPFMKEKAIELQPEEIQELVECYKRDIGNQSLTDLIEIQYVGQIQLLYGEPENNTNVSLTLYIGKNHNNLIRFFEERDICFTLQMKTTKWLKSLFLILTA